MTLNAFRTMVEANEPWFAGVHPEPASALDEAERALGIGLPPSLRWLLGSLGYSAACGIDSLDEVIAATKRCRSSIGLPSRYVVLNDWGDAGVVVLDAVPVHSAEEWPVYWMGVHNLYQLAEGHQLDRDCHRFDGFAEWVQARLVLAIENAQPGDAATVGA